MLRVFRFVSRWVRKYKGSFLSSLYCLYYAIKYRSKLSLTSSSLLSNPLRLIPYSSGNNANECCFKSCLVTASKIIYSIRHRSMSLYVFDRKIQDKYWELRNQYSVFHNQPKFWKVDDRSFFQATSVNTGTLLSLNSSEACSVLKCYLHHQFRMMESVGVQTTMSEFLDAAISCAQAQGYWSKFPAFVQERVQRLSCCDHPLTLVPSPIEPWPALSNGVLMFCDLSPVEFRQAPVLHDLCYMLFKYELYGDRREGHEPLLAEVFKEVSQKSDSARTNVENRELIGLSKMISKRVSSHEFLDAYICMILYHCVVKYEATGRFKPSSEIRRVNVAIERHSVVLSKAVPQHSDILIK